MSCLQLENLNLANNNAVSAALSRSTHQLQPPLPCQRGNQLNLRTRRCTLGKMHNDIPDDNVTAMTNHLYRDFRATSMHENALSIHDHGTPDEYSTVKKTTSQNLWPRIHSN